MCEKVEEAKIKNMHPNKEGAVKSLSEIKELQNITMDKGVVKKREEIQGSLKERADKKNVTLDKKEINKLSDSSASVILKLKKYYNRPRPREQAKQYGLQLENIELSSMKTPSYPSGHSAQGILIGNYLADKYKDQDFKKIGNEISDARNVARAHYKSDSDMGKKLGESMYNYIANGKR